MADATKGVKKYTDTLNSSIKSLGTSFTTLAKDLNSGARGAAVFNNSIEAAGDLVSNIASKFGILGLAVGAAAKLFTMFVGSANKQSDKLFETFQNLSRTGAVGGQAMTDVFQGMKRFGYTLDELDKMTAVLAENSRDFAVFSGTVATGGKQLSVLVDGFKDYRVQLQSLGLTTDEQVRAAAGYVKQMGRLGRTTDATSAGALSYIKEMETLTRLTGLQRKELEDQLEQAEQENQFYAEWEDMSDAAQRATKEILGTLKGIDPSGRLVKGYIASVSGLMGNTEEQSELFFASGGRILEWTKAVNEGRMSAQEFKEAMGNSAKENYSTAKAMSV
jgi:hypothetical protein